MGYITELIKFKLIKGFILGIVAYSVLFFLHTNINSEFMAQILMFPSRFFMTCSGLGCIGTTIWAAIINAVIWGLVGSFIQYKKK